MIFQISADELMSEHLMVAAVAAGGAEERVVQGSMSRWRSWL